MDEAYNQHAKQARRKNRSTTNLNHLTLAPLTPKLPLADDDELLDGLASPPPHRLSYLEGKSAPTTPGLLTRSPVTPRRPRSRSRGPPTAASNASLQKSKSASHLAMSSSRTATARGRKSVSGTVSPNVRRRRGDDHHHHLGHSSQALAARDSGDSDWLLRVGALISTETREYKGQAWLVSRASSTSLTGLRDADDDLFERELARERELAASRHPSRRGSVANGGDDDDFSPVGSRRASRAHSRVGSRTNSRLLTPVERNVGDDGYFSNGFEGSEDQDIPGPDFVNLDEKLEATEQDTSLDDEATIRRLVKSGKTPGGTWVGNLIGWSLFSVAENEEEGSDEAEDDDDEEEEDVEEDEEGGVESSSGASAGWASQAEPGRRKSSSARHFEAVASVPEEEQMPAPTPGDEGGWKDAAWLLSVASKVLL